MRFRKEMMDTLIGKLKSRNTLRATWALVVVILWILIGFPAAVGSFDLIVDQEEGLSAEAGIQLAILATALGAVTLWLSQRRTSNSDSDNQPDRVRFVGRSFLFSALWFTLFALLVPYLPEPDTEINWWGSLLKYADAISLMFGSTFLALGVLMGILEVMAEAVLGLRKRPGSESSG